MQSDKAASATQHIAVLAFPFGTHAGPLLELIRRISAAAPDVSFSFFSTARSNDSTFPKDDDEVIHNVKPYNVSDGLPEGFVFRGNPQEPVDHFLRAAPGNFKSAMDVAVADTGKGIDCLLTDAFLWFAADLAQELNVPWVALWTGGPRPLFLHVETDNIRRELGADGPNDRPLDFLPEFSAIFDYDLPEGVAFGDLDTPFPQTLHKMGLALSRATAVVANSYDDLDAPVVDMLKSRFQKFLNVGPFNLASQPQITDTHGCLEFLNKHEPGSVAYISFGSIITPPPHELAALAEALEETRLPFLWSFRGDAEQLLPKGFTEKTSADKGKIVPWAPQMKVLEHPSVGVFITHGGWNSTLDSIIAGVPILCRPFFGDQNMNRRTLESVWGIGLGFEGGTISKDGTIKALSLILSSEEGKKMREKIEVLKQLAFKAVEPNGSSTTSFKTLIENLTKKDEVTKKDGAKGGNKRGSKGGWASAMALPKFLRFFSKKGGS